MFVAVCLDISIHLGITYVSYLEICLLSLSSYITSGKEGKKVGVHLLIKRLKVDPT